MSGILNIETAIGSLGRIDPSSPVVLGNLTLTGVEVPSVLEVGGAQALVVSKLPGGDRIIQAMGSDPAELTLGGMFTGPNALARAQTIANLRDTGREQYFGVAGLQFRVRIASFSYGLAEKLGVIRYTLTLIVQPTIATTPSNTPSALSALVGPDVASALTTASRVSLFHVAAQELGNPAQWFQIAALNGLSDPSLASFAVPVTLLLPAADPSQQAGLPVLSA